MIRTSPRTPPRSPARSSGLCVASALTLAATLVVVTPGAARQPASSALERIRPAFGEVDRMFEDFARNAHAPGAAWGIVLDGALVHTGAYGVRDADSDAPVDADTVFRIASMTKSFTALSILKLRDEGKLSLDDPAERYVPELAGLAYPTADSPRITIRHLLSHSAGFPEDNPWGDRQLARTDAEMAAMMRGGIPFSTTPGTTYEYSNYGFAILGRVVANVSGQPYARYVSENVLRPLGMSSTTLQADEVPAARLAHGYRWLDGEWVDEPPLPDGAFGPMGGMLTSSRDLARWVGFLLGAWPPRDDPETGPVRRASAREMQQVWRPRPTTVYRAQDGTVQLASGGYGFGLGVRQTCDLERLVSHTGGLPGYGSVMTWLPERGIGVFGMVNLTYTSSSSAAADALALLVERGSLEPRSPEPSPALVRARADVDRLLTAWDDALADRIAAENLFLDETRDRRRRAIETLLAEHGVCRPSEEGPEWLDLENALRGRWQLPCEHGDLEVSITLAPTMPPSVQFLNVRPFQPREPAAHPFCRGL